MESWKNKVYFQINCCYLQCFLCLHLAPQGYNFQGICSIKFQQYNLLYFHSLHTSRVINKRRHLFLERMVFWKQHGMWGKRTTLGLGAILVFPLLFMSSLQVTLKNGNPYLLRKLNKSLSFLNFRVFSPFPLYDFFIIFLSKNPLCFSFLFF